MCIFSLLFTFSCKDKKLSNDEMNEIFKNQYGILPEVSFQLNPEKILFYGVTGEDEFDQHGSLFVMEKKEDHWQETDMEELGRLAFGSSIDSIQLLSLGDKSYLYFETTMAGGNMGNFDVIFGIYDPDSYEIYSIDYEYLPGGMSDDVPFTLSENLSSNPTVQSFLEEKAYSSPRIVKENEQEQLEKNFLRENEAVLKQLEKSKNQWITLNPIKTKQSFCDLNDSDTRIENDSFIVTAYFKGPVVGYDKLKKEYIMIWALESHYDWMGKLSFDASGHLNMYFGASDTPSYVVDLQKSGYMKLY